MSYPKYHIEDIHASTNPEIGERIDVRVAISLEWGDVELTDDGALISDLTLEMELWDIDEEMDEDRDPNYGDISLDLKVYLDPDETTFDSDLSFQDEINKWSDEGIGSVDADIIQLVEGGLMPEIMSPLSYLFEDSFANILPRLRFTPTEDELDESEEESEDSVDDN